jgi:hypothetical protein
MLATEIALKGIPVRVNAIAPGVYESEMTQTTISGPEEVAKVAECLIPVPAGRAGSYVKQSGFSVSLDPHAIPQGWRDRWHSYISFVTGRMLYQWPGNRCRRGLYCCQSLHSLMDIVFPPSMISLGQVWSDCGSGWMHARKGLKSK